jgi:hypothetical protein
MLSLPTRNLPKNNPLNLLFLLIPSRQDGGFCIRSLQVVLIPFPASYIKKFDNPKHFKSKAKQTLQMPFATGHKAFSHMRAINQPVQGFSLVFQTVSVWYSLN